MKRNERAVLAHGALGRRARVAALAAALFASGAAPTLAGPVIGARWLSIGYAAQECVNRARNAVTQAGTQITGGDLVSVIAETSAVTIDIVCAVQGQVFIV